MPNWHGMLSPQTPSCNLAFSNEHTESKISGSFGNGDDHDTGDFWADEPSNRKAAPFSHSTALRCKSSPFSSENSETQDQNQHTSAISIKPDADIALQLSGQSTTIRRSKRLRGKVQTHGTYVDSTFSAKATDRIWSKEIRTQVQM